MALTLPREAVSVPLARGLLAATLERAGVMPSVVDDIKVALTEACTNAYQHVEAGETYEVAVGLDDDVLTLQVIDHGPGFAPRPPEVASHDAQAGRGIDLIRALTDTAAFGDVWEDEGGSVRMWKKVAWRDRSPWLRATQIVDTSIGDEPAT